MRAPAYFLLAAGIICLSSATGNTADSANQKCEALKGFSWPDLVVDETTFVPAGPARLPNGSAGPALPEHCLFRATLSPRKGAEGQTLGIGMEVRLPLDWNGRFAFQGGGGLDGVLQPSYGNVNAAFPPALGRGFAVVSTDGGHRGKSMMDASFALDQQARLDYAYNALGQSTSIGKAVITAFYGRKPDYSYFVGCSNGGRQAMMAAQRFPRAFDGIVAGDPTFRLAWTNVDQVWNEVVLARAAPKDADGKPIVSQALSDSDLKLVSTAVLKACDAKDGLSDGMINDFRACHFDPAVLTCKGTKTDTCLAPKQVTALKELMGGPHDSKGRPLYAAFPYDTGIGGTAFRQMHFGSSPTGKLNSADAILGFDSMRYYSMTPPDPTFDAMSFDFDRDISRVMETSKINDADSTYLVTFAGHGKLILYHGLSDQGLSPLDTTSWYDKLAGSTGGVTQDWARLFMVPGMTHCAGGQATDEFDMLAAIQAWVEKGQAPDRIHAKGKALPGVTRPLCPYPKVARYDGKGPKDNAESFRCEP
jgi:Tannase and feruloyl esterase